MLRSETKILMGELGIYNEIMRSVGGVNSDNKTTAMPD